MSISTPVSRAERLSPLSRHSSALDAHASAGSSPTIPENPLTRRELRELRGREASLPVADVELTSAAAEAPVTLDELLLTPKPPTSTSTEILLQSRASLRAEQQPTRSGRVRQSIVALPDAVTPSREFAASSSRASSPSRALAPVPPRVQPGRGRVGTFAAKGATIAAMAFVSLMAVSTSLPAEALLSSADVQAAALEAQRPTQSGATQSIELADVTGTVTVQRDGYESRTIAEVAAASGIRMEATFTNNPNGTIQWPFAVGVHIGDRFGYRNCAGCSSNHGGQDFNPGLGAPIQAIADGVVSYTEDGEGSLGVHMIIDHMINGQLVSSVYAHMIHGSMLFKTGDVIKVGQVLGKTGSTGMSTGPHLHLDIRIGGKDGTKVDPLEWLYANTN